MSRAAGPWAALRSLTPARVALGRVGSSLPTASLLNFELAHAQARDAVHAPFHADRLQAELSSLRLGTERVRSAAADRTEYLRRPDLGRQLNSATRLEPTCGCDLVIVVADGLSALAAERHALPLLQRLLPRLTDWRIGPIVVAEQARVALGDAVAEALQARLVLVLIGERPGLSAFDSLGVYLTYAPRVSCQDSQRNCISNIRLEGLPYDLAAHRLSYLLEASRRLGLSGVSLKDDSADAPAILTGT